MGISKRKRRSNLTMDEPQIRFGTQAKNDSEQTGTQVKASWDS